MEKGGVNSKVIMSAKLFVGNLSFNATENQLQDMFAAHGNVIEVDVIMDKFTGRPRGFAFVTMENKEGADAAIQQGGRRDRGPPARYRTGRFQPNRRQRSRPQLQVRLLASKRPRTQESRRRSSGLRVVLTR